MRSGIRLLIFVAVTIGVLAAAFFGLSRRYTVHSDAMEPTLKRDDHVAVFRFQDTFRSPHRQDVVVVKAVPQGPCRTTNVGRIVGLPRETVSDRAGVLYVDGKPLKESYVRPARRGRHTQTWHVPADAYLVLGDNRRSGCALEGFVPKRDVVGTVFLTFWPADRISIG